MYINDRIGFIGLGVMGKPLAHNLAMAGFSMIVWNRSQEKALSMTGAGVQVAFDVAQVFACAGHHDEHPVKWYWPLHHSFQFHTSHFYPRNSS